MANAGTILPLFLQVLKLQVLRSKENISGQMYFSHLKHSGNYTYRTVPRVVTVSNSVFCPPSLIICPVKTNIR